MKIKIKMNLVQKIRTTYPEFVLDTHDFPVLEGKTLDEIRMHIENHAHTMHSLNGKSKNLLEEINLKAKRYVMNLYPRESHFYVTPEDEMVEE